ncbi:MAG: hypothetical protein JNL74_21730 [Fibrobacteres bacterium]|nr:hypothetical protein [Fibrobacterota bacterium]
MKKFMKAIAVTGIVCSSLFADDSELAMTDTYKNFESSKMFSIPTTDVINSKDICLEMTVGSTDIPSARGTIGLGNVAEISGELGEVQKDIAGKGDMSSSAGLKVRVLRNNGLFPGLAFMLSKNTPETFKKEDIDYNVNSTDFYTILKHGGKCFGHDFAVNYGLRLVGTQSDTGLDSTAQSSLLYLPFAGLKVQINESVTGMIEYEQTPTYDNKPGFLTMTNQHVIQGGVRFFAKSWLAFNFGAKYCMNPNDVTEKTSGLANAQIIGKMHLNIPTSLLWKRAITSNNR